MGFVVAVDEDVPDRLKKLADRERARERAWLNDRRAELPTVPPAQRPMRRVEIRAELTRLRAEGELAGSRNAIIARGVRRVLASRGWNHDWPAPPPGASRAAGRPWGVTPDDGRIGQVKGIRIWVELPDELEERVRGAAYWQSDEAVEELQAWAAKYGPGPGAAAAEAARGNPAAGLMLLAAALGPRPDPAALAARDRARARVVTTGDILRAGINAELKKLS